MRVKFRHFFTAIASFFLSACNGGTPTNTEQNEITRLSENVEVSRENEFNFDEFTSKNEFYSNNDVTKNILPENVRYSVSGDDDKSYVIVPPEPLERVLSTDDSYKDDKIASFSTKVYTKTADRVKNLHIVCDRLSGTILNPGEEFSYNETCGPYNKENGFGKATVFINGEEAQEYGGGVCQLSSTLYNAIKGLNIEILERHNHSNEVYYVPLGDDATVSYGVLDFRFKNNENYPIEIEAYSNENKVTVSIYKI